MSVAGQGVVAVVAGIVLSAAGYIGLVRYHMSVTGTRGVWLAVTPIFLSALWLGMEAFQAPAILRQAHADPEFDGL